MCKDRGLSYLIHHTDIPSDKYLQIQMKRRQWSQANCELVENTDAYYYYFIKNPSTLSVHAPPRSKTGLGKKSYTAPSAADRRDMSFILS